MTRRANNHFVLEPITLLRVTYSFSLQYIQKKSQDYAEKKEITAWSMDKFNEYINDNVAPEKDLESDWVYNVLTVSFIFLGDLRLHCKV